MGRLTVNRAADGNGSAFILIFRDRLPKEARTAVDKIKY
jgi:hypothetical protein